MEAPMIDVSRRLNLEPGSGLPLYHQLREQLRQSIRAVPPSSRVPPEKDIMAWASVSRATVRRAIGDLVQEGLLVAHQGRGTFTAPQRVPAELGRRPLGFTEAMVLAGRRPGTRVLACAVTAATADVARQLEVPEGNEVVVLERLRLIDGEPAMLELAHLPAALCPGLAERDLDDSLYAVLRRHYGLAPAVGEETIVAVNADQRLARLLHVPVAAALLATARTTRTDRGTRLEYTRRHARGDLCSFFVELRDSTSVLSDQSFLASLAGATR
jgi:GntR family transcriptional regulator